LMPRPTAEAKAATKSSFIADLLIQPSKKSISSEETVDFRIKYKLRGGIYDSFTREAWQVAWQKHDIMLRLISFVEVFRKGISSASLTGRLKFVKKGKLYWTRNPDLTDNVTNRIWAFVVDEDSNPRFFDSEEQVKEALFDFDRVITVAGSRLGKGNKKVYAKAEVKWGRHIYVEKGRVAATSPPAEIKVE